MRVSVDRAKCQGTGYCAMITSAVFEIGSDGLANVLQADVDESQRGLVVEARDTCPTQAIAVELDRSS